jgi:hypothetical protein
MDRLVAESPYFSVKADDEHRIVRIVRSAQVYPDIETLNAANARRLQVINEFRGKHYKLLLDARLGPMRNDPAFEAAAMESRNATFKVFDRVAILVKTAVGALQMQRLQTTQKVPEGTARTFENDEAAALKFLTDA